MVTKTSMPKMRSFTLPDRTTYLSKGVITEKGKPKVSISWWATDYVLREIEKLYNLPEGSIQLPTLYESHRAAEQDPEIHESVFKWPAEWQNHLILNPDAPTETDVYVLKDINRNEKTIEKSKTPRNLIPVNRHRDGNREVVITKVFDIPFKLIDGRYDTEDLDPETGFLTKLNSNGKYNIWFGEDERLYPALLSWPGHALCGWEPGRSPADVGIRGRSTGNIPPELLESKTDVLRTKLERVEAGHRKEMDALYNELKEVEEHYKSGLQKLQTLEKKLKHK